MSALERKNHSVARLGKALMAALLAVWVLAAGALSADSSFHHRIHANAGHADDNCALCLFLHGMVDSASAPVFKQPSPAPMDMTAQSTTTFQFSNPDLRLFPSRAAPFC